MRVNYYMHMYIYIYKWVLFRKWNKNSTSLDTEDMEAELSNVCAERLHVMSPSALCQPSTVIAESLLTYISSSFFTAKLFSILL